MESILEKNIYWFNLAWQPRGRFQKKLFVENKNHGNNIKTALNWHGKNKTTIENDNVEEFNKVQIFDNTNKLIDGIQ